MKQFLFRLEPLLKALWFLGLSYIIFAILRHWLRI